MELNNDNLEKKEILEPAPNQVPRCLIEFCCHCYEDEWEEFHKKLLEVQKQLENCEKGILGRILYYKNNREVEVDTRIKWLSDNANAQYIKFINVDTEITEDFVEECFSKIDDLYLALTGIKEIGLIRK